MVAKWLVNVKQVFNKWLVNVMQVCNKWLSNDKQVLIVIRNLIYILK